MLRWRNGERHVLIWFAQIQGKDKEEAGNMMGRRNDEGRGWVEEPQT